MLRQPFSVSFFLSKDGAKSRRISGPPGKGHIELAKETLGQLHEPITPGTDLYQSMFNHGYARVMIDGNTVYIDKPKALSTAQNDFAVEQAKDGKRVVLNSKEFIEMRQKVMTVAPLLG